MWRLGMAGHLRCLRQDPKSRRQNFPFLAPETQLPEKLRLAAVVGMCRIEQIIRDLLAPDHQLVWIRHFHCSAGGVPEIRLFPMPIKIGEHRRTKMRFGNWKTEAGTVEL